jgi:hypothetical protein
MSDAAGGQGRAGLQAGAREEPAGRPRDAAVAHGRCAAEGAAARRTRRGPDQAGGGRGVRPGRDDRRVRGHVEGAGDRRALRRRHHAAHAARGLVDGQEHHRLRIADLLRMSSGLRLRAPADPDYDPSGPYPDHTFLYTGSVDAFRYAARRPLQWPPNTVGRYRNTDPVPVSYLVRLGVEKRGEEYLSFPQRALFDKIEIRTMVLETESLRQLPHPGLRAGLGAGLGAAGQSLSSRWRVERRAPAARGLREVRPLLRGRHRR